MRIRMLIILLMLAGPLHAQQVDLSKLDKLAAVASNKVELNIDASTLSLASKWLSDSNIEDIHAKKVIAGLDGIYIRTFTFAKEGSFNAADLQELRAQLRDPHWTHFVSTGSLGFPVPSHLQAGQNEFFEIWVYRKISEAERKNGKPAGGSGDLPGWTNETIGGLLVLSTKTTAPGSPFPYAPSEVTVVNIVGSISPEGFFLLGGHFGIPSPNGPLKKDQQ